MITHLNNHLDHLLSLFIRVTNLINLSFSPDAANPVGVALVTDGVLALGEGVPQLDGLVPAG